MRYYLRYNGEVISTKEDERAPTYWAFRIQDNLEDDGRRRMVVEKSQSFDSNENGPYVIDALKMRPSSLPEMSRADVEKHIIPCLERKTLAAGSREEFYILAPKK